MTWSLPDKARRAILDRDYPHIPLTPEEADSVEPGTRVVLKQHQVWVTLQKPVRDRKAGWVLPYVVRDDRPRLMRRNPHGMDVRDIRSRMDEFGIPRRVSEQDAAEAAETSHYTQSVEQAVANESEEVVPADFQGYLTDRSKEHWNALHYRKNTKQELNRLTREIRNKTLEAERRGFDATLQIKALQEQLAKLEKDLDEAA